MRIDVCLVAMSAKTSQKSSYRCNFEGVLMWLMSQSTSESVLLMGECDRSCRTVKL